jgi:hypothetical protein
MIQQLKTDLKFHPSFRELISESKMRLPKKQKLEADQVGKLLESHNLFSVKTGKYEMLFDGFRPLLDVDLKEEFVEKLFTKRNQLAISGSLWELEPHRIARLVSTASSLYGRFGQSQKGSVSQVTQFYSEGYLLENLIIAAAIIIVTESHLM